MRSENSKSPFAGEQFQMSRGHGTFAAWCAVNVSVLFALCGRVQHVDGHAAHNHAVRGKQTSCRGRGQE